MSRIIKLKLKEHLEIKTFIKIRRRGTHNEEENGKIAILYRGFYAFGLILSSSITLINVSV